MTKELTLLNDVKDVRLDKNITQAELAETVGVSRNTIVSIENGRYCPSAKLALQICIALDKKFEDLFFFDDEESEDTE
ncbi:MAG: helix-turn-helix transcriptional regulator [Treponema sp.]|uniref:helix-turn-helix transcriptional regulator n=1 Tax=Treponema sp. TaxID=166 RepID=UPI00298E6187|nr:helix-turn-helix transcriptional regulator [Treponema sp.]MCQ2601370.1 helix-turn-helix transcriptional regulator [Treponema sp.]